MRLGKILTFLVCLAPAVLRAQILYWDTNGATAGGDDASGTWDLATAHWSTDSSLLSATGTWSNGSTAYFGYATSQSIWLQDPLTAGGITLSSSRPGITINGPGILTFSPGAIVANNTTMALDVVIAGSAASGTTAFTLSGIYAVSLTQANTFNGQLLVNGGNLTINNASAFGASGTGNETRFDSTSGQFLNIIAPMTLNEGFIFSTYRYVSTSTNAVDLAGPIVLDGGGLKGQFYGDSLTISGTISETGGAGTFIPYATLTGNNTFTGALQAGMLTIANFNNAGVAGPLGMGGSLQLGYDNTGPVDGTVRYTGATAGSNRGIVLYGSNNQVDVSTLATYLTLSGTISNAGGGGDATPDLEKTGQGRLILAGNNTYTGNTSVTNGALIAGSNTALGSGVYVQLGTGNTGAGDTLNLLLANGVTLPQDVDITNANSAGVTSIGTYSTGVTATFAGDVDIQRYVYVSSSATNTLNFTGGITGGLTAGSINQDGGGLVTYTGGISLPVGGIDISNAGSAQITGSAALGDILYVRSGSKLSGTATIANYSAGNTTFLLATSGGIVSPGLPTGTLTTPGLYMASGSFLNWKLNSLTSSNPAEFGNLRVDTSVVGGGSMEIYATSTLTVDLSLLAISLRPDYGPVNAFWQVEQIWKVVDFIGSGSNSLTPGTYAPMLIGNGAWTAGSFDTFVGGGGGAWAAFDAGDVYLRFTPVPEPSTYALLGLGGVLLVFRRRRRARG